MRVILGFAVAMATAPLAFSGAASAHEFFPPEVTVTVSHREPAGHPNLRTVIELEEGATFEEVRVVAPPGSSIAADVDIPDGTIVGRLDGVATTNAIVLPDCDLTSSFAVTIREATTDPTSPDYPQYLSELAPGRHRLRLVADVSPSAEVPILVNYLFDINDATGSVESHTIVGNPLDPPDEFRTCTPTMSTVTLYGQTSEGHVLLTNAESIPEEQTPFTYTFTSRPDEDGHRHDVTVETLSSVGPVQRAPVAAAPQLTVRLFGVTGQLEWSYSETAESFVIEVITADLAGEGHSIIERFAVDGAARTFFLQPDLLSEGCGESVVYRIAAVDAAGIGEFAESEPFINCGVAGPENPLPNGVAPPDAGSGPRSAGSRSVWVAMMLAAVGSILLTAGTVRQRR